MAEARRRQTQARRREVLMGLLISMGATLVLGILPGMRVFLMLHLVVDALFAGYCMLLVHLKGLAAERSAKVRYLDLRTRPVMAAPAPALPRRAVN